MKKRGFTLVELLAVIVILAVILVIAIPKAMNTINKTKENSLLSSARILMNNAEKEYTKRLILDESTSISCDDVAKMSNNDYKYCNISFDDNGVARVTLIGSGKFEGLAVCSATKNNIEIDKENGCATDVSAFSYYIDYNIEPDDIPEFIITDRNACIEFIKSYEEFEEKSDICLGNDVNIDGNMYSLDMLLFELLDDFTNLETIFSFATPVEPIPLSIEGYDISYGTDVIIPKKMNNYNMEVNSIDYMAFLDKDTRKGLGITSVLLPDSISYIALSAFRGNKISGTLDLSNLTNLTDMYGAFSFNNITKIILPSSIKRIEGDFYRNSISGELDLSNLTNLTDIFETTFSFNNITKIILPNSIERIENCAFCQNNISGELDLSNLTNLTDIYSEAFSYNNITKIILPSSITNISSSAFLKDKLNFISNPNLTKIINLNTTTSFDWSDITGQGNHESCTFVTDSTYKTCGDIIITSSMD